MKFFINNELVHFYFNKIKNSFLEAISPSGVNCIFCDNEAIVDSYSICDKCAANLVLVESCNSILNKIHELDGMNAIFRYVGSVADGVKRFKYNDCTYLASEYARFMEVNDEWKIDIVVPVPLHKYKKRLRGYNQCELLAEQICINYKLELNTKALTRVVYTKSQARQSVEERETNLIQAFEADEIECKGKNILIIDDVCTTGSTIKECASALKSKGANKVYALVLCLSREGNII